MTGRQAFTTAASMLGYVNDSGISNDSALIKKLVPILNLVYADLFFLSGKLGIMPIENVDLEIDLPEKVLNNCFVYGVAMFLAQSENDGDNQQMYANLYNKKRSSAGKFGKVENTFLRDDFFE